VQRIVRGHFALGLTLRGVYRRLAVAWEAVFLVIVVIIVLYPLPPDQEGQATLADYMRTWRWGRRLPELATLETVEFLSNVIMFTPLAFLAAAIVRPTLRWLVPPALTALSAGIEFTQYYFLPDRVATVNDVLSNSIGGVLGLLLFLWASRRWYSAVAPLEYLIGRTVPRTGLQVIEQWVHAVYVWPVVDFLHRRKRAVRPDLVLPTTVTVLAVAVALSVLILPGALGTVLSVLTSLLLMAFGAALLAGFHRAAPRRGGMDSPSEISPPRL
jgi:VanZ like family